MNIRRADLEDAARSGVLTSAQAATLWDTLSAGRTADRAPPAPEPRSRSGRNEAVALAAGLAAAAPAAWLLLLAWERWGGAGGLAASAAATAAALGGAQALRRRAPTAAGVLLAAALALVPFAIHAAEHVIGYQVDAPAPKDLGDWLLGHRFPPLAAAGLAAVIALRAFRHPVLGAVLVAIAWFAAMDAAPTIFGAAPSWSQRALLSALVGLLALGTGFAVDGRVGRDHAGWLYLAGLVSLWGGLTTSEAASPGSVVVYASVQVWLLLAALLVRRRSFAAFGAVGLAGVAGRAAEAALDPAALPFALALVAGGLVAGAVAWTRFEDRASAALVGHLPRALRRLLPPAGGPPFDSAS